MKIKQKPEDFIVEEVLKKTENKGSYTLCMLRKTGIDTLSCIKMISEKIKIPIKNFGYCGLKDKVGITSQYISILGDIKLSFSSKKFSFKTIGKINKPLQRGDNKGNRFVIRVYEINKKEVLKNIEKIRKRGFVNYYDTQRTGYLAPKKSFGYFALKKNYKDALLRYYIHHSKFSQGWIKKELKKLFRSWPEIPELKLPWDISKPLNYLKSRNTYKEAIMGIPKIERELLISGFQALLWNRIANIYIRSKHRYVNEISLPTEKPYDSKELEEIYQRVLKKINFNRNYFKNAKDIDVKVNHGKRKLIIIPENFSAKFKNNSAVFSFFLPAGSYATTLVKMIAGKFRII